MKFKHYLRFYARWFTYLACLVTSMSASAFTTNDANTIFNAYSNAFYYRSGTNGWFENNQTGGNSPTYFWGQAEEIECVIDAYEWSSNTTYQAMITNLLNGFIKNNGSSWSYNTYNDDIMWAAIAFARGGVDTGNFNYCSIAKANFDACYARAWDTNLGGGLYWDTGNWTKNACVNGPATIAACLLYHIYGDVNYLNKATNIYAWQRSVLVNTNTGAIYDSIQTNGAINTWSSTYNQGTFIGAANFLGQTNDAALAANYTMNNMAGGGILPQYGTDNNNSGFNAIFIRWMTRFIKDRGLNNIYQPWLQDNANAAWNMRRSTDNLSWCQWLRYSPSGTSFYSWDCISSMEVLQTVPPTQSTSPSTAILTASDAVGASSFTAAGNWSVGAAPAWSNNCIVSGVGLRTPSDTLSHSFYGSALILTNGGALRLATSGGATITVGTVLSIDNGIVSAWSLPAVLVGNIILQSGGGVFDPQQFNSSGFTVSASIGGTGGLTVGSDNSTFGGNLYLSGYNTYSGGTTINGPDTLSLTNYGTLGSSNAPLSFSNNGNGLNIPYSAYTTAAYGTLNLNGSSIGVGNLTGGGGKIANNATSSTAILTIGNGNNGGGNYQGIIMDHIVRGGVIALVKTGSGTITLSGANTYSGGTTIMGGTLQLGDGTTNNGSIAGNITNSGTLAFANPAAQSYGGAIIGSGNLLKAGSGTLTITGKNSYSGSTIVNAGTLVLGGLSSITNSANLAIASGATLDVTALTGQTLTLSSGQILKGGGTIIGNLTALTGAMLSLTGALAVQNNVSLSGTLLMGLNRTNLQSNDQLVSVAGIISGGGALVVTNLGPALQAGDLFQLFNTPVNGFKTVSLPQLTGGNIWINRLGIDGTIQAAMPPSMTPPPLAGLITGDKQVKLTWPTVHIGWRLEVQTNFSGAGLGTNWVEVFGSSTNNLLTVPINWASGSVFFRLVYP
jgi:autotransporter-associated beta strand protein